MLFAAMLNGSLTSKLSEAMYWLFPLLALGSAIVCFATSRVSSRLPLLAVGFLLEALAGLGGRFVQYMMRESSVHWGFQRTTISIFCC